MIARDGGPSNTVADATSRFRPGHWAMDKRVLGLISAHMLSGESIETWLDGYRAERRKSIPRRRQGHEYNMLYSCSGVCGPNHFSWIWEKHIGVECF